MELVKEIESICKESGNEWFLEHQFSQIALYDLSKSNDELDNNKRVNDLNKLNFSKILNNNYDFEKEEYFKSKWIIPDKINGEIPGFILIKYDNGEYEGVNFTHTINFAFVKDKYRKKGILKNMVNSIPKEWNIWLEPDSLETELDVEYIWNKCGFIYHTNHFGHIIYKRLAF